jgi:lipoprotein-releasing system ATP-binding protein
MASVVELTNIAKTYPGVVPNKVLKGVTVQVEAGTITAIMGQSGSGKTTLMNCIGLLDVVDEGSVVLRGISIANSTPQELAGLRNDLLGFIFQFHYLLPEFTALENVLMPAFIRSNRFKATSDEQAYAVHLLEQVGLKDFIHTPSTKLSGGQQQRVAIARALMNKPAIVLADEPTGNLDSVNGAHVLKLFKEMNTKLGTTFIIVTHDERVAAQADATINIHDGIVEKRRNHG